MREIPKLLFTVLLVTISFQLLIAQNRFFTDAGENTIQQTTGKRLIIPEKYRAATLNTQGMKNFLWSLPAEKNLGNRQQAPVLELPMPGGGTARFHVWESSIMEPGLEQKFPEIRTFLGQGIDDPYASIRFDYNPYFGFSAQILSVHGNIYIDPFARGDINNYISYYGRDNKRNPDFVCNVPADMSRLEITGGTEAAPCRGTQLYSYRLAVACTGEYAVAVCSPSAPTVNATLAAIVTSVNRVTGVYENELAVRLILIANDNLLINLNGATDPYTNNNPSLLLSQNQSNIDQVIGTAGYDIGHVFSTQGGGIAQVGCVCNANAKANGVTGITNPVGDNYDIDYVAHEMGHQFGCFHSYNGSQGSCGPQLSPSAAYEVGSGTTIMCYAGICGSDNIQLHSDPFFHSFGFDQVSNFVQAGGNGCKVATNTLNTLPVIISMSNSGVSIPISTPFTLTASAFDPDADPITYCWEEWDLGPTTAWNGGNANTTSPLFKSRPPVTSGSRTFPDMAVILAGYPANPPATMEGLKGETLPTVARALKFRLTIRDNRAGGGGIVTGGNGCQTGFTSAFQINTVATAGPFAVTAPNGGENYAGGSLQTITWNVVGTDQAPISCANVKISLSTDGGLTYPTVMSASTPNDGSEVLAIPGVLSTTARIKVEAVGNIFFDISNANFTISAPVSAFDLDNPAAANIVCPPPASASITLGSTTTGGFVTPINLSATGAPAGTSISFGTNPLTPGQSTTVIFNNINALSSGTYAITVTGVAGALTRTRVLNFIIQTGTGPVINTQPVTQNVCAGGTATFTVAATGASGYQWQLSTDGGNTFNNIAGATTATYSIPNVQLSNNGRYRSIVTGPCNTTTSSAAILTVQSLPAISSQPQSITLCAGSNNTFSVTATGTNITYQWQLSTDGGANFNDIPSATATSYTINGITSGLNNNRYRVIVSGDCVPAAVSAAATLTVETSVAVTTQPTDVTACAGSDASFSVVGSGAGIIYQWQLSTDGGANFNNIAGANAATYTVTGVTLAMDNNKFRVQLSNATCTTPGISNTVTLTINSLPLISSQPQAITICEGANTTFSVTASATGITYQWQVSTNAVPAFTNIGGANSASYTVTGATAAMNSNQYHVVIGGTCSAPATSNAAILTVITPVSITTQPVNTEVCSAGNTSFTVAGNSTQTINYQWQLSTDAGVNYNDISNAGVYSGTTTAALTITGAVTELNSNQYRVLLSNATCTVPTVSAAGILTVRQQPSAGLTAAPLTSLLPGQSTTLTATPSASTGGTISNTWIYNAATVPNTGNTRVVTVEQTGDYSIRIQETWPGGLVCSNESPVVTISAPASSKLYIFPSPNDGQFIVSYYNAGGTSTSRLINVFDSHGARIHNQKFNITGPYTLLTINIKPAQGGVYIVTVGDAGGKKLAVGKVMVQ
jgi:Metallo-peptidase family M12B Reprolysin-like